MSRNKQRSGRGFILIAAFLLLTIGATARFALEVDSPTKKATPSKLNSSVISSENEVATKPEFNEESSNENIVSTPIEDVSSAESEPKKVAAEKVLTFSMPLNGEIYKNFSADSLQFSKTYGDMRVHNGIDILVEEGTTIKTTAAGTVKEITTDPLWGTTVVISHRGNIESYYCGLNDTTVKKGQTLKSGKIIGTVGEIPCECLDDSHLHFAIKQNGAWVSPQSILGLE